MSGTQLVVLLALKGTHPERALIAILSLFLIQLLLPAPAFALFRRLSPS